MAELAAPSSGPTRAEHAAGMAEYLRDGERLVGEIGNRGPVRFDPNGKLRADILDAYWKHGFYIFEGVIGPGEVDALRADVDNMLARAPVRPGARVDAKGRPALGRDYARPPYNFIKPLSDPWGGTDKLNGRHPSRMTEPAPDPGATEDCTLCDACVEPCPNEAITEGEDIYIIDAFNAPNASATTKSPNAASSAPPTA